MINLRLIVTSLRDKKSSGRMMAITSISSLVSNFLNIISSIIIARWLLPQELGLFNGFSIVVSYIVLLQLGVPSGLSREYPYYIGKSEGEKSLRFAAAASAWSLLLGIAILIVSAFVSLYFLVEKNYQFSAGIIVIGISSFQTFFVTKYLKILFRSNNDFNKLANINMVNALVAFSSIIFVKYYGFYGLCVRAILLILSDCTLTWFLKPVDIKPKWSKEEFLSLLKVGMPIYWVANIYSLWPIFARTLVGLIGGAKALGLYGMALMIETAMAIVTTSISTVVFPKMASTWGKTHRFRQVIDIALKPVLAGFFVNLLLIIGGWILLPFFIKTVVPNFTEGVTAARWSLIVGLLGIFSVFSNIYMVVQKNTLRLVGYLTGFVFWLSSLYIIYKTRGFAIEMFPQAMCFAYLGFYIMDIYFFRKLSVELRAPIFQS